MRFLRPQEEASTFTLVWRHAHIMYGALTDHARGCQLLAVLLATAVKRSGLCHPACTGHLP